MLLPNALICVVVSAAISPVSIAPICELVSDATCAAVSPLMLAVLRLARFKLTSAAPLIEATCVEVSAPIWSALSVPKLAPEMPET